MHDRQIVPKLHVGSLRVILNNFNLPCKTPRDDTHSPPTMSTIASPRDPSMRRTPTSSARPSIDTVRSAVTSPVNNTNPTQPPSQPPSANKRSHRAALREYYNLRAAAPPRIELPDSEVPSSDLDAEDFDTEEYVGRVTQESSLEELLRLYTRVLGEVRALDAEKKALVYDNYSKLITATETIRKVCARKAIGQPRGILMTL